MTIQYVGSHLGEDLYKTGAEKYIRDIHYCIYTSSMIGKKKKKDPIFIQYIKYVCNILASAGIIVNSERASPSTEMCLFPTVNTVRGGSGVHNRIKTITISDSNQAQVQHSQRSTHLNNIQTNTVLKPTQASMFFFLFVFFSSYSFNLHTSTANLPQQDVAHIARPSEIWARCMPHI